MIQEELRYVIWCPCWKINNLKWYSCSFWNSNTKLCTEVTLMINCFVDALILWWILCDSVYSISITVSMSHANHANFQVQLIPTTYSSSLWIHPPTLKQDQIVSQRSIYIWTHLNWNSFKRIQPVGWSCAIWLGNQQDFFICLFDNCRNVWNRYR